MESLANNHPFLDGNKRVAFAAAHTFLLVNGYDLRSGTTTGRRTSCMMQSIARGGVPFHTHSRVDQQSYAPRIADESEGLWSVHSMFAGARGTGRIQQPEHA